VFLPILRSSLVWVLSDFTRLVPVFAPIEKRGIQRIRKKQSLKKASGVLQISHIPRRSDGDFAYFANIRSAKAGKASFSVEN